MKANMASTYPDNAGTYPSGPVPAPSWQIHALRYGTVSQRQRHQNFMMSGGDIHESMPLDFFVWAIINPDDDSQTIVVDTGFDQSEGDRRDRALHRTPAQALASVGVDAATVTDVVITHLHYDHAGTTTDFPQARFHLQDREMAYATGRHMSEPAFGHAYSVDHVVDFVRHVYGDRVVFHDGDGELAPGITVHHIGGHTDGLQVVRVETDRGAVVLASDAAHYYANLFERSPFPIVHDVAAMVAGWDRLRALAASDDHIIPGHDPQVLALYPASFDASADAVRVDLAPSGRPS